MAIGSIGGFLPLSGGTLTGPIIAADGSLAVPSIGFASAPTTGLAYSTGVAVVVGGTGRVRFTTTELRATSGFIMGWTASSVAVAIDAALSRVSAGVVALGNGTAGNTSGTLQCTNVTLSSAGVLKLGNTFAAGVVVSTGTLTAQDLAGNTYRLLCAP